MKGLVHFRLAHCEPEFTVAVNTDWYIEDGDLESAKETIEALLAGLAAKVDCGCCLPNFRSDRRKCDLNPDTLAPEWQSASR